MLKRISCNDPRFKAIDFEPGLNLIVADKTTKSSKKDTRNGLGKSTFIEIIHFCLGADYDKLKTLKAPELKSWEFRLDFSANSRQLSVLRSLEIPQRVILSGDILGLPIGAPSTDHENALVMSNSSWTLLLGSLFFDLPITEPIVGAKYKPSFRSLISYFMRRSAGSFLDPFCFYAQQREADKQVCNTFLLGLNYEYAAEFQKVKDKEADIKARKKQVEQGNLPGVHGRLGELDVRRVQLQQQIKKESDALSNFQVNPHYGKIEKAAAGLTRRLHELSESNVNDSRLLEFYQSSLQEESEVDGSELLGMYTQLGVEIPQVVAKRFEDVQKFHLKLLANRRQFLKEEIASLMSAIDLRNKEKDTVSSERAGMMSILKTQGALEEYSRLQEHLNELTTTLKAIDRQIQLIGQVDKDRSNLTIEKELLLQKAQFDFGERILVRERAISLFNENSQSLYNMPGELIVELGKSGYKFGIEIEKGPSEGVGHMKILCYDLTIQQLWRERNAGPAVLIHDSTLFDGVDERQCASALTLLHDESIKREFQYIVAMNTDEIPYSELKSSFQINDFVRCRLTDRGEHGGLLGFRLKSTEKTIAIRAAEEETSEENDEGVFDV